MAAGLLGSAASLLLAHFAQTSMGVMRDLYVRNEIFNVVLESPVAFWSLRVLAGLDMLVLLRSLGRAPLTAFIGFLGGLSWLVVSFYPTILGLATPWMLAALGLLLIGCLGAVFGTAPNRPQSSRWKYPDPPSRRLRR
jgi:hypothetical protein